MPADWLLYKWACRFSVLSRFSITVHQITLHMDIFFLVHNHLRCMFNCRGTATEKKVPFREQYGKIGECRCFLPAAQFIAMTATASKKTEKSICENLQIREHASIRMSCNRNNIRFVMSMPYITSSCLLRNFAIFYCTHVGLLLYWFSTAVFIKCCVSITKWMIDWTQCWDHNPIT